MARRLLLVSRLLLAGALTLLAQLACAETYFDYAAKPLAQALRAFSRQVERPVLFNPTDVAGKTSTPVEGDFSPRLALQHLLRDTGMQPIDYADGWVIRPATPAKTTSVPAPPAGISETLVLGYYTGSLRSAQAQKREAERREDIILAERMGRFPALNIAEAIKRSPGVSVVRDRGEALFISIRGLPTYFNSLTINGAPVASNENTRTSEQYGRRFHYDTLPTELVSALQVQKTSSAGDPAGAIGGRVNLQTYQPLAQDGSGVAVSAGVGYSDLAESVDPRAALIGHWQNAEENFGVLLGVTHVQRNLRQDRALNFRWLEVPGAAAEAEVTPGSLRPTLELEERERTGLNAAVQWQGEQLQLAYNGLDIDQSIDYQEYSYSADYDPTELVSGSAIWRGNALIAGQTLSGSSQLGVETAGLADRFGLHSVSADYQWRDWQLELDASHSRAQSVNHDPIRRTRLRLDNTVALDFAYPPLDSEQLPGIRLDDNLLQRPWMYPGRRLEWRRIEAQDKRDSASVALRWLPNSGWLESLTTGLRLERHNRDYQRRDHILKDGISGEYFSAEYFASIPVDNFLSAIAGDLPKSWRAPLAEYFWQNIDEQALLQTAPSAQDQLNSYRVEEQLSAWYGQMNFALDNWRGNLGLRYEHSRQRAQGYAYDSGTEQLSARDLSEHYGYWLPAINLVYEASVSQQWRLGLSRTLNRPDLQDLAPRLTFNSGDMATAEGGNPYLRPVNAWQADLTWEWYFAPQSLLSASVFYTRLQDFIHTSVSDTQIDGQEYQLSTKTNGGRADVGGLELIYQQVFTLPRPLLGRLGVDANIALLQSRADYYRDGLTLTDDLAQVSPATVNLGVFYEWDKLGIYTHYNWRDKVLEEVGDRTLAAQNKEPFGTLDAQISFELASDFTLLLQGINLTGAAEVESYDGTEFAGYTYYGKTFLAGIKARF
ncbi:TonB-dependent receptor [Gilvimarinus sp. DA14]|uniref:TonB-dependent receptor n=1 Tax=Gilvimarinus sp. DA14 TaxID=2956798 RepID=UPI0020B74DFF|nr:TonB-dependent receptor [Gilvimarinus sp. DA14]UTF60235.1 TonB-dependent receptor [Gilvimarinus sp. DA14]